MRFNDKKWDIIMETNRLPLDQAQGLNGYYQINNIFRKLFENWDSKLTNYEFITRALLQRLLFEIFQNTKKNNKIY